MMPRTYDYDECLSFEREDAELAPDIIERLENDDHFNVSYGVEGHSFFSSVSFEKDGVSYMISTFDDISDEDLFSMARELIIR